MTNWVLIIALSLCPLWTTPSAQVDDKMGARVPAGLSKEQETKLNTFLAAHAKPATLIPPGAKVVNLNGDEVKDDKRRELGLTANVERAIKQHLVEIRLRRPAGGQAPASIADVYYFRPNPQKGKKGVTVRLAVDLSTGQQAGQPEVILDYPLAFSREELAEAVTLAREKSKEVKEFYQGHGEKAVTWDHKLPWILPKEGAHTTGERVVFLRFASGAAELRVTVNLTKESVTRD
jgi:hypothetical protein